MFPITNGLNKGCFGKRRGPASSEEINFQMQSTAKSRIPEESGTAGFGKSLGFHLQASILDKIFGACRKN